MKQHKKIVLNLFSRHKHNVQMKSNKYCFIATDKVIFINNKYFPSFGVSKEDYLLQLTTLQLKCQYYFSHKKRSAKIMLQIK